MAALKICQDAFPVLSLSCAIDRLDFDVRVAHGCDLVVLIVSIANLLMYGMRRTMSANSGETTIVTKPLATDGNFLIVQHTTKINNSWELIAKAFAKRGGCLQKDIFTL